MVALLLLLILLWLFGIPYQLLMLIVLALMYRLLLKSSRRRSL